jgi:hypothetical protein
MENLYIWDVSRDFTGAYHFNYIQVLIHTGHNSKHGYCYELSYTLP